MVEHFEDKQKFQVLVDALDELEEYLKGLGCEGEDASHFSNYLWTYKSENYVPSLAFRKGSTVYETIRQ